MKCLIIIITAFIFIISIIGLILKKCEGFIGYISLFFTCISGACLFSMFMIYVRNTDYVSRTLDNYNKINYLIEVYDISKDESLVQLTDLLKNVSYINEEINSNRNNKDNLYIGCFYSEKIAELELINVENLKLN